MDDGQFEKADFRKMSQHRDGPEKLRDDLPATEIHTSHDQNLNESNVVLQTQSISPLQYKQGESCVLHQKSNLHNIEKEEEVKLLDEKDKGQSRGEDEEEDSDEVMKEEEESEESSSLICCHSPDTPMTDSSYSETGSLLESSCAFSPGTSPEPTSPVIPVEYSQCAAEVHFSGTRSDASSTQPTPCPQEHAVTVGSAEFPLQDGTWSSPLSKATDGIAKTTDSTTIQLTSSTEPCRQEFSNSYAGSVASTAELTTFTKGAISATESTVNTRPASSNCKNITSTTVATCTTVPPSSPGLLESLEQLTHRGDDSLLPQYLHQIAEAFVDQEDYQRALCCIQLEKLYHQRVLDNLKTLQEQWEIHCGKPSSGLETQQLDTLKHICQTHTRPRAKDAEWECWDLLKPKFKEDTAVPSCTSANQMERVMAHRVEEASSAVLPSINFPETLIVPEKQRGDPSSFDESQQAKQQASDNEEEDEAEAGVEHASAVVGNGQHPCAIGEMDQSVPAEQQGKDLDSLQEKEATSEEDRDIEEAEEALEMEDEGDEEAEEESQKERDYFVVQKGLSVETLGISIAVKEQPLHQDSTTQEKLYNDTQLWQYTQESSKTCLDQETQVSQEINVKQQEQEEEEEEEYEDYEEDQARILREASSLDDMAKLITIEEISPASGLVSILKKRNICADNLKKSASSESQPEKPTAKRCVRFRVPDEGFEHDVGSGDSCLLLVLLCLVTVVISIGGTALYCALGDTQSSVCQDFSRNADFYFGQIQRGIAQVQHWFALRS